MYFKLFLRGKSDYRGSIHITHFHFKTVVQRKKLSSQMSVLAAPDKASVPTRLKTYKISKFLLTKSSIFIKIN